MEGGRASETRCIVKDAPCDPACTDQGVCLYGRCECDKGWAGEDCSLRVCHRDCSNNGFCLNGTCICNRRYTGDDCSVDVALLKEGEIYDAVAEKIDRNGKIDREIEHFASARSAKKYHYELCSRGVHSKACSSAWLNQMVPLIPLLPRDDTHLRYPSCAIVSSGRNVVYNATEFRETGRGEDIDSHRAVIRLNNAPTEGFEAWVGKRTTHRLVEGDYAQMVQNMLGTEVTVNETKSVVTPMNWWVGGFPHVQKVTYLMAVYPSVSRNQVRPPENNGYASFADVFPGTRRYIISPQFLREVGEIYSGYRETIKSKGLGCYKAWSIKVPQIFTALIYSLQVCQKVHIYGISKEPGAEHCCYYKVDEGFSSRNPVCDEITKNHILRMLLKGTKRLFLYD